MKCSSEKVLKLISLWVPVLIQMGLIFFFSAQPKGSPALESFPLPAGLGHFVGYGLLGLLLYRAFNSSFLGWSFEAARNSLVVGFLYAVSDELHQLFVPGRHAALIDVVIDTAGIIAALLMIRLFYRNQSTGYG